MSETPFELPLFKEVFFWFKGMSEVVKKRIPIVDFPCPEFDLDGARKQSREFVERLDDDAVYTLALNNVIGHLEKSQHREELIKHFVMKHLDEYKVTVGRYLSRLIEQNRYDSQGKPRSDFWDTDFGYFVDDCSYVILKAQKLSIEISVGMTLEEYMRGEKRRKKNQKKLERRQKRKSQEIQDDLPNPDYEEDMDAEVDNDEGVGPPTMESIAKSVEERRKKEEERRAQNEEMLEKLFAERIEVIILVSENSSL